MDHFPETMITQSLQIEGAPHPTPKANPDDSYSAPQNSLLQALASDLQRLNQTIAEAVDEGMTIELVRRSRHHTMSGSWGDQMMPVITRKS